VPHIPFATLAQRHTVYAYAAVFLIHAAYALNLLWNFHQSKRHT